MEQEVRIIPEQRDQELIKCERVTQEYLSDIASGIKDILQGKLKEI